MFTVQYKGRSKDFSSKDHAIKYMIRLDCGSDLWVANTLLRSRVLQPNGYFRVTVYNYDGDGSEYSYTEDSKGNEVLVLGKGEVRISLRDPNDPNPCVGPFTKVS